MKREYLLGARRYDHPEPVPVDVDDLDIGIGFEVFPQSCHENIHAAGGEIILFSPDLLEGIVTCQDTVFCTAQHSQEF